MLGRDALLQEFLTSLAEALPARAIGPEAAAAIGKIYGALRTPGPAGPSRLGACRSAAT